MRIYTEATGELSSMPHGGGMRIIIVRGPWHDGGCVLLSKVGNRWATHVETIDGIHGEHFHGSFDAALDDFEGRTI
jgi:hypothetical protein